jgi:hypothetical protein
MRRRWLNWGGPWRICCAVLVCLAPEVLSAPAILSPDGSLNISAAVSMMTSPPADFALDALLHGAYDDRFEPNALPQVNLGLATAGVWFRFTIAPNDNPVPRVLELDNPRLQSVVLYVPRPDQAPLVKTSGTTHPVALREYFRPAPAFELAPDSHRTQTVYLHVQHTGSLRFKALLWPKPQFLLHMDRWMLGAFISLGAMLVMGLHSLGVCVRLREPAYLYHGLMCLLMLLTNMAINGSGALYLWPETPWWTVRAVSVFVFLTFAASIMFATRFLRTEEHAPRLARLIEFCAAAALIATALSLTEWFNRDYVSHALGFILPLLVGLLSVEAARREHRWVRNFFLAHSVVFAGLIVYVLLGMGWLPSNMFTEDVMIYSFVAAGLLWSFALSDQVRALQQEVQSRLERTVVDRTTALNQALSDVQTLQRLVPICSCCKKVRNDSGYWNAVEEFLSENTDARLTHHLCPDCAQDLYPGYKADAQGRPSAQHRSK